MLTKLKNHLSDNSGNTTMQKMVLVLIVFVISGILLAVIYAAVNNGFGDAMRNVIRRRVS